jgi:hypothetical protein
MSGQVILIMSPPPSIKGSRNITTWSDCENHLTISRRGVEPEKQRQERTRQRERERGRERWSRESRDREIEGVRLWRSGRNRIDKTAMRNECK